MNAPNPQQVQQVLDHLALLRQMDRQGASRDVSSAPEASAEEVLQAVHQAMEVYGPMAEHLSMKQEQREMLDLAVKVGYPEDYAMLRRLLLESEAMCESVFKTFALPIYSMLDDLGIEYTFLYRMKSVYSIWRKMRVDHKQFDDVYDLFATRIVYKVPEGKAQTFNSTLPIENQEHVQAACAGMQLDQEKLWCWRIYNVISSLYRIHPDRIKDWVSKPKPSGYQAVQLTVMGPDCNWIEIQIRSERMDYNAEYGSANHANYKNEKPVM